MLWKHAALLLAVTCPLLLPQSICAQDGPCVSYYSVPLDGYAAGDFVFDIGDDPTLGVGRIFIQMPDVPYTCILCNGDIVTGMDGTEYDVLLGYSPEAMQLQYLFFNIFGSTGAVFPEPTLLINYPGLEADQFGDSTVNGGSLPVKYIVPEPGMMWILLALLGFVPRRD